jgi:hypothetical protein
MCSKCETKKRKTGKQIKLREREKVISDRAKILFSRKYDSKITR